MVGCTLTFSMAITSMVSDLFLHPNVDFPRLTKLSFQTVDYSTNRPRFYPLTQVTHMNDALLSQIDMQPLESFTFKGANDEEVQGFLVKPPGFDPNKKYPVKFLIHGGPQGAWGNDGRTAGTRSCSRRPEITWW